MKLIATKNLRYAGRSLVSGDEFEASSKDARLLKALGKAGDYVEPVAVEEKPRRSRKKYNTRSMTASIEDGGDTVEQEAPDRAPDDEVDIGEED